ncbi:V-type ATP synthase subunit A [Virgisporangium ochraceum]
MTTLDGSGDARVMRVTGPLVEIIGTGRVAVSDQVLLGPAGVPGEVVAIRDGTLTVQSYEYTGGLRVGDPVRALRHSLAARLGPGLLGGVFDGLLRPLDRAGAWLGPELADDAVDDRRWSFRPTAPVGAPGGPGVTLGVVAGPGRVDYRILVPPDGGGRVDDLGPAGTYRADDVVATVAGRPVRLTQIWPVRRPRPVRERLDPHHPLATGQRAIDVLFPVAKGSTAAVPGGFGTGKTMLLQQIAKWSDADVIVYVGCGERGNELAEVVAELGALDDPRTGGRLADRTVVVANTSNMPMMAREVSVHAGATVAEYFRDMGYDVVVIADSTSRWAEAMREFASRSGALPAEEGYPADLASALAAFYERAASVHTLGGRAGSVTVIGAVSPPGGDLTEPVTVNTERFVRCLWTLDRALAYARQYPAVSWSASYSRDAGVAATAHARGGDPAWSQRRSRAMAVLAEAERLTALAELVGAGSLPARERVVLLTARLMRDGVLQQNALAATDAYCGPAKSAALVDAVLTIGDRCRDLADTGVPVTLIEETDFGPLLRARERAGPDDAEAVRRDAAAVVLPGGA